MNTDLPPQGEILPPFAPGIYPALSDRFYHAHDGMSSHRLGSLIDGDCPAQLRYDMLHPSDPSDEMNLGTAVHTALLEPDTLDLKVVRGLQIQRRSNADKETWAAFEKEHDGKIILPFKMYDKMEDMVRLVRSQGLALGRLLDMEGDTELTVAGECPLTGVPTQIRIDKHLPGINAMLDLKTVGGKFGANPNPRKFKRDLGNYNYHTQGRTYRDIANQQGLEVDHYLIGVIQKNAPYLSYVVRLEDEALDVAGQDLEPARRLFAECWENEEWPAYPDEIEEITLEQWRLRKAGVGD